MNMAPCNLYKFYKVSGRVSVPKSQGRITPSYTIVGDLNPDNYLDIILVLETVGVDAAFDATEYKRPS